MKTLFDFNKARPVLKNRDSLLRKASEDLMTIPCVIAEDYADSFCHTREDALIFVEDMNLMLEEYRTEYAKAEALLPADYLKSRIQAVKADETISIYQKYCILSGIWSLLYNAGRAAADGTSVEEAILQTEKNAALKEEVEVDESDLDEIIDLILSTGSVSLLTIPDETRASLITALMDDPNAAVPEFDKNDLILLDAYCIYKAIKKGRLIPESEWKHADSPALLRTLIFRTAAEQDVREIIKEVAGGRMTWEEAEKILTRISAILLGGLALAILILAAAGTAAAFLNLSSIVNIGLVLLLFGSLAITLYGIYRGFDAIEEWLKETAAPALASAGIRAAKKAVKLAKEGRAILRSWRDRTKSEAEVTNDPQPEVIV